MIVMQNSVAANTYCVYLHMYSTANKLKSASLVIADTYGQRRMQDGTLNYDNMSVIRMSTSMNSGLDRNAKFGCCCYMDGLNF